MKVKSLIMSLLITGLAVLPGYSEESEDSKSGEKTEVKIYGYIQAMPKNESPKGATVNIKNANKTGTWKINGKTIRVEQNTSIEEKYGIVKTGAYVKVEGYIKGKEIIAKEIEVKKAKTENEDKVKEEN